VLTPLMQPTATSCVCTPFMYTEPKLPSACSRALRLRATVTPACDDDIDTNFAVLAINTAASTTPNCLLQLCCAVAHAI